MAWLLTLTAIIIRQAAIALMDFTVRILQWVKDSMAF